MIRSLTVESTILPKAPPMITPTARSTTLPLTANCLNSLKNPILALLTIAATAVDGPDFRACFPRGWPLFPAWRAPCSVEVRGCCKNVATPHPCRVSATRWSKARAGRIRPLECAVDCDVNRTTWFVFVCAFCQFFLHVLKDSPHEQSASGPEPSDLGDHGLRRRWRGWCGHRHSLRFDLPAVRTCPRRWRCRRSGHQRPETRGNDDGRVAGQARVDHSP